jgi:hypothetical protein
MKIEKYQIKSSCTHTELSEHNEQKEGEVESKQTATFLTRTTTTKESDSSNHTTTKQKNGVNNL